MSTIFISYRRADSADTTGRIVDRLVNHFGKQSIFIDVDDIEPGANVNKNIRLSDPSDIVRIEVEIALERELRIIPLLVGSATPLNSAELPESLKELAGLNALPIRQDPDFNNDLKRLIYTLEKHFERNESTKNKNEQEYVDSTMPVSYESMYQPTAPSKHSPQSKWPYYFIGIFLLSLVSILFWPQNVDGPINNDEEPAKKVNSIPEDSPEGIDPKQPVYIVVSELDDTLKSVNTTLGGITNENSAKNVLPILDNYKEEIDKQIKRIKTFPDVTEEQIYRELKKNIHELKSLVEEADKIPRVNPIINPVLQQIMDSLDEF